MAKDTTPTLPCRLLLGDEAYATFDFVPQFGLPERVRRRIYHYVHHEEYFVRYTLANLHCPPLEAAPTGHNSQHLKTLKGLLSRLELRQPCTPTGEVRGAPTLHGAEQLAHVLWEGRSFELVMRGGKLAANVPPVMLEINGTEAFRWEMESDIQQTLVGTQTLRRLPTTP